MKNRNYLAGLFSFVLAFIASVASAQVILTEDSVYCGSLTTTLHATVIGDVPLSSGIVEDDIYAPSPYALGFTFDYYGDPYTQVLIGANGNLCFDFTLAGAYDPWPISGVLLGNTSVLNSICGPWCDIYVPAYGTITYSNDGTAPNRRFIVNFCTCAMFSCTTQWITTQMVLNETSNKIDVYVAHKTFCTSWNGGYAIIGVQNATGTDAVTAPGRDYPATYNCVDEGWEFTPISGGTTYSVSAVPFSPVPYPTTMLYWYDSTTGAFIDSGSTLTVSTTTPTTYTCAALGCGDTSFSYIHVAPVGEGVSLLNFGVGGPGSSSFTNPDSCGKADGTIKLRGHKMLPTAIDTVKYDYNGVAQPPVHLVVAPDSSVTLTGLCAGIYSNLTVTQGACTSATTGPADLTDPPIAISGVMVNSPDTCGKQGYIILDGLYSNRSFTINYEYGGVAQPSLTISSNGAGSLLLPNLCAGAYSNIVASYTGCDACITPAMAGPYNIINPPTSITSVVPANPSEFCVRDGSLLLYGVYPGYSYTVTYDTNGVAGPSASGIATDSGTITLPGLNGNGTTYSNITASYTLCTAQSCVTPPVGPYVLISPEITPDFTEAIYLGCHGDTVDFINTSSFPNSILPPIASYAWTFGDISPEDTSANPQHIYLTQGTYTVTLTVHNRGCSADTSEVISLVHPLHAGLVYTPASAILCQGSGATFTDTSSGGIVSSKLYFGTGATVSNTANVTYQYNNYGNYNAMLVVTDNVPCSDTVSVLVQVDSQSNVALNVTDSVICRSNDISFTGIYTTSGNTGITWNFGDGDSIQNINPAIHSYDATGTFTVTATAYFRACRDTSASKVITLFPQPSISIGPADTSICAGSSPLVLADNINSGNPGASWVWSTGQTGAEITVSSAGTYTATVSIHGCKSAATVNVTNDCYMSIPNVFTPNNDGLNDYFFPRTTLASGLISFSMSIYDRWGGLVYQSSSLDGRGWDGKLNNVAEPQGVYVYVIDATFKDGEAEHHQGNVTLIR